MPCASTSLRTSFTDWGRSPAIFPPFDSDRLLHPSELDHLHRDRQRQPVLAIEVESRHALDALQALSQRVGVDVQQTRRADGVSPAVEEGLERSEQLGS